MEVNLTYMKSPWEFSLQFVKHLDEYRTMMKRISVLAKPGGSALNMSPRELTPDLACLAKHVDNKWYRAQVCIILHLNKL
jgi:hypothetical protein